MFGVGAQEYVAASLMRVRERKSTDPFDPNGKTDGWRHGERKTDGWRDGERKTDGGGDGENSRKSTSGSNKMFPAAYSGEFPFSASTCQGSNLSEEKAIYTGIKRVAESTSEAASAGFGLFWRLREAQGCGGGRNFIQVNSREY